MKIKVSDVHLDSTMDRKHVSYLSIVQTVIFEQFTQVNTIISRLNDNESEVKSIEGMRRC